MLAYRMGYKDALAGRVACSSDREYLAGYRQGTREIAEEQRIEKQSRQQEETR